MTDLANVETVTLLRELGRRVLARDQGMPEAQASDHATPPRGREGFLSYRDVARLTSLSVSTLKRRVRSDPGFPKPFRLGEWRIVFDAAEVRVWRERMARRRS